MSAPDAAFIVIADRTGSTGAVTDPGRTRAMDFTDGIRQLVTEQAAQGETVFTLVEFMKVGRNAELNRVLWFAPGEEAVATLKHWSIMPCGNTPLLDAVGAVMTQAGEHLAALPADQRPKRVYFVIATDGEENSSREYTKPQVGQMIEHQREVYKWEVVFVGAGFDAFAEAGGIGVAAGSTMTTDAGSSVAMAAAYAGTSSAIARSRVGGQSVSYTSQERKAAMGESSPAKGAFDGGEEK